LSMKTW